MATNTKNPRPRSRPSLSNGKSKTNDCTQEQQQENNQDLKYLDFVQLTALNLVGCLSTVYDYAKDNSGPLKSSVQTIEGTVKTVVGPVYDKYHDVPIDLLKFVDHKVDASVIAVENHVPSVVKAASNKAISAAQKAPEVARAVASEVQREGLVGSAKGAAKNAYDTYEPVAEVYAVSAWKKLNTLPLFPKVAHVVVPTANYTAEKYNDAVNYTAEKGYTVSSYLPLVPTKKIAQVFGGQEIESPVAVSN
ncbi:hypothetical protein ACHQM5_026603 [Ranunculus cassubicifolius]